VIRRILAGLAGGILTGIATFIYLDQQYSSWPIKRRYMIAAGGAIVGGIAGVLAARAKKQG